MFVTSGKYISLLIIIEAFEKDISNHSHHNYFSFCLADGSDLLSDRGDLLSPV